MVFCRWAISIELCSAELLGGWYTAATNSDELPLGRRCSRIMCQIDSISISSKSCSRLPHSPDVHPNPTAHSSLSIIPLTNEISAIAVRVSQGTKLAPVQFCILINRMAFNCINRVKYAMHLSILSPTGRGGHMWGIWLFRRIFSQNPYRGAPKVGQIW